MPVHIVPDALEDKIKPQQPKKAAQQPSRFDQAANNAAQQTKTTNGTFSFSF